MKINGQHTKINTATSLQTIGVFISNAKVRCRPSSLTSTLKIRAEHEGDVICCKYDPDSLLGFEDVVGIDPELSASVKINGLKEKDWGRTEAICNMLRDRPEVREWDYASR